MKIVDRKTFLSLPSNTLFSKYTPYIIDDFAIKMESIGAIDFWIQDIVGSVKSGCTQELTAILNDSCENGTSFDMDFDVIQRDAEFEDDQLYLIWERKDVLQLIERLSLTL